MRILAIDLGTKRVGLAGGDRQTRLGMGLGVIQVTSQDDALHQVAAAAAEQGADELLLGVPLNMDGTFGGSAIATCRWGRTLADLLRLPIVFVDERLSSFEAEQTLNDRKRAGEKLTRARRKGQLDAVAAQLLLQEYLDGRLPPLEVPLPGGGTAV